MHTEQTRFSQVRLAAVGSCSVVPQRPSQLLARLASQPSVDWLVECCFTSTVAVGLLGTGAQDGHLDFHTAPELWSPPVCFVWPFYTASLAFRHRLPNSAGFGYAIEGALFMSAQLSTDFVSALRKFWVLMRCGSNAASKHVYDHEARPPWYTK